MASERGRIDSQAIQELVERIAREFAPERIILFGSYAYGNPTPHSDVDLLVVMPYEGNSLMKAVQILRRVAPPFAVDLIVRAPDELRQRLEWHDFFLMDVTGKGKVMYESANA